MILASQEYTNLVICSECNGEIILDMAKGESVCRQCGLIVNERELDISQAGVRAFSRQEFDKKINNGTPISPLLPDIGLCTLIYKKNINNPDLKRVVRRDSYLEWETRNLLIATNELKRISHVLNLPLYLQKAILNLYKETFKAKIIKGRSISSMIAACIYYVCKKRGIPRTFNEIIGETSGNHKTVKRSYKSLINGLHLKIHNVNPIVFIPRYISDLQLPVDIEKLTIKLLKSYLARNILDGISPQGLCAGAIYMACKLNNIKINQKVIAHTIGITEVTLRTRHKEMSSYLNLIC